MTDRGSDTAIEARLRAFLEAELRQAESDFPQFILRKPESSKRVRLLAIATLVPCLVAAAVVLGSWGRAQPNVTGATPLPVSTPSSSADGPSSGPPSRRTIVAEAAGLKLVAGFDRMEVEAGATVAVALRIENTRSTDVVFEEPCETEAMTVEVLVPVEPIGRAWDGIAAAFKTYALEQSTGSPIESSIRTPMRTTARMQPCHATKRGVGATGRPNTIIEAGTTYETVLTWKAEIVGGLPAPAGTAPFSIKVLYDLESAASGLTKAETLEATGIITVVGGAPGPISAGEALDAVLGDPEFAAWLEKEPQDEWVNANLFLQSRAFGVDVLPEVPYWDVELYREPRSWAVMYIDAVTGEGLGRTFCDIPCDR